MPGRHHVHRRRCAAVRVDRLAGLRLLGRGPTTHELPQDMLFIEEQPSRGRLPDAATHDRGARDERPSGDRGYSGCAARRARYGIDTLARRVAVRRDSWRTGAFRYHPDHDAWVCPQDQWLWPTSFDPEHRVMRYRGQARGVQRLPGQAQLHDVDRTAGR